MDAQEPPADVVPLLPGDRPDLRVVKQRHGASAAILAAALTGLRDVLQRPREQPPVVQQLAGEPEDLHGDGITIPVEGGPRARVPELPELPARPAGRRSGRAPRRRR
ncbi:MAG: hypothetical protein ACKO91_10505 [Acidimicrobiales bacterium]